MAPSRRAASSACRRYAWKTPSCEANRPGWSRATAPKRAMISRRRTAAAGAGQSAVGPLDWGEIASWVLPPHPPPPPPSDVLGAPPKPPPSFDRLRMSGSGLPQDNHAFHPQWRAQRMNDCPGAHMPTEKPCTGRASASSAKLRRAPASGGWGLALGGGAPRSGAPPPRRFEVFDALADAAKEAGELDLEPTQQLRGVAIGLALAVVGLG